MVEAVQSARNSFWLRVLPLFALVALSAALFWPSMGDDLAASFIGCRILATHQQASLYSHDPVNFAGVSDADKIWPHLALEGHYTGYLHPYVQTPLWAWGLGPLCQHTNWPLFKHLFLVLALLASAACIALTAYFWTPRWCTATAMALIFAVLLPSEPFFYAMKLVQTHVILLLLTIVGLLCAERGRPVLGGFLVASAAAVKITPGILLLYWLAARRWRAAASLLVFSGLLLGATRLVAGQALFADFLSNMHRVSGVLLVSENNQSLAATIMGSRFSADEVFDLNAYALPAALKQISLLLMSGCALLGGWMDHRRQGKLAPNTPQRVRTPFGAGIALTAMTLFAPIAWTHYFIVLVVPLMMLGQAAVEARRQRTRWFLSSAILLILMPLYRPLAPDVLNMDLSDYALLRGVFYAGTLCLITLFWVAWRWQRSGASSGAA